VLRVQPATGTGGRQQEGDRPGATSTEPSFDIRQDNMATDSNAGKVVLLMQFDLIKK
jgi:hypothetical protein